MDWKIFSVRLPADLVDALDRESGPRGRNGFIRRAIEKALGIAPSVSKKTDSVVPRKDDEILLEYLGDRRLTKRQVSQDLDWTSLRIDKAAEKLVNAGLIKFVGGVMERK